MGLKSPSDGRWDGRGRTGFVTSPYTEKKKDALIRTFWQRPWLMGISPLQMDVDTVDQDATRAGWTTSRARGSHVGLVWHV
jgi:hypothetical protein